MAYSQSNRATELIKELKRSDWIPKYNSDGINSIFEEMDTIIEEMLRIYDEMEVITSSIGDDADAANNELINGYNVMLNIHHCTFYHDKRCLLAYLKHRLDRICEYRWNKGPLLSDDATMQMSKGEVKYFQQYDQLLSSHMQRTGFDLTSNLYPPRDLYVEVVATCDYGEFVTASGTVILEKNSIHYLRLSDIEYLIQQGVLEVKKTE